MTYKIDISTNLYIENDEHAGQVRIVGMYEDGEVSGSANVEYGYDLDTLILLLLYLKHNYSHRLVSQQILIIK